jgi:hypothetical protein
MLVGIIKEALIKTMLRFHLTLLRMAIIKNKNNSFTGEWMELENIILSEVSQVQKDNDHMFSLICGRQIKIQIYIYIYTYI